MKARPNQAAPPLDAAQWIEAAFDALAEGGIDAVRIDPLAKQLGVTRGSFYWHFKDRDALHQAMLRQWRERTSYMIANRAERSAKEPDGGLNLLVARPQPTPRAARAASIELAIRIWARRDKNAAKAMREIDNARMALFTEVLERQGATKEQARRRSFLFYSALMSEVWIMVEDREAIRRDLEALLLGKA